MNIGRLLAQGLRAESVGFYAVLVGQKTDSVCAVAHILFIYTYIYFGINV